MKVDLLSIPMLSRMPLALPRHPTLASLLQKSFLILMQLRYESKIRFRNAPFLLNICHRLCGGPPIHRHEERTYHARAATDALHAVHEDIRVGVEQSVGDKCG